ncbi:MAG: ATP-binding protein [Anaerolineales bacterium]|nr:ATP-binding protein [Anaerolineales bacterium]
MSLPVEESPPQVSAGELSQPEEIRGGPRSLRELIDLVSGRGFQGRFPAEDAGLLEQMPFPFLALVGQPEMKLALILVLINPALGGVLLIGPRGTGKTTAVRSLVDLLPEVPRSLCHYGCLPEDVESGGIDAVCPDCARKYAEGEPLARLANVNLIELPLNARMEDVVGGLDERAAASDRARIRRGILAQADRNLLYIDEVNLLDDEIVDAILDAAAQGRYTVRRGPISATYRARFSLIGSMNPEEGHLRSQIMDRFGLRVLVRGLDEPDKRLEAYRRVQAYQVNPRRTIAEFQEETALLRAEIQAARDALPDVVLPEEIAQQGLEIIQQMKIDSLRAEISLFEAARAYAAADARAQVVSEDLKEIAPLALRGRRSSFMVEFLNHQQTEEAEIQAVLERVLH